MDVGIYRGILKITVVLIGAIHFGNLIAPGIVMWGFSLSRWVSAIVLFLLLWVGYFVFTDEDLKKRYEQRTSNSRSEVLLTVRPARLNMMNNQKSRDASYEHRGFRQYWRVHRVIRCHLFSDLLR